MVKIEDLITELVELTKTGRLKWQVSKSDQAYWAATSSDCSFTAHPKTTIPRINGKYARDGVVLQVTPETDEHDLANPLIDLLEKKYPHNPPPDRQERLEHLVDCLKQERLTS